MMMAFHRDVRVHLSQLHVSLAGFFVINSPPFQFFCVVLLVFYQIRFNFDGFFPHRERQTK